MIQVKIFDSNRDSVKSFDARLGTLQIDGAWFAPDYGKNNGETIVISESGNMKSGSSSYSCSENYNDGSPNDWIARVSFDSMKIPY